MLTSKLVNEKLVLWCAHGTLNKCCKNLTFKNMGLQCLTCTGHIFLFFVEVWIWPNVGQPYLHETISFCSDISQYSSSITSTDQIWVWAFSRSAERGQRTRRGWWYDVFLYIQQFGLFKGNMTWLLILHMVTWHKVLWDAKAVTKAFPSKAWPPLPPG